MAYSRLDFLRPELQEGLDNSSFVLYTILGSMIAWAFINYGLSYYQEMARDKDADMESIDRLLPLVRTFTRGLLVVVTLVIILHHFGIEITAIVAALGLTGFALSLAAKDTLTNIISGLTIAVNRPFRINDRIYNKDVGGWVDNERVYQAIQEALDAHGIVSPGAILDVNYHLDQQDADRLAPAFQTGPPGEFNG